MTSASDLDTPAVTVDLDVMEANIRRVQAHLDQHGIANRPHIKTHKIPEVGRMQMAAGAVGITCQKLGEVEVFTDADVADDVLLTFNILGRDKTDRLMALSRRSDGSRSSSTTKWSRAASPRPARPTAWTSRSSSNATRASAGTASRRRTTRSTWHRRPCGSPGFTFRVS